MDRELNILSTAISDKEVAYRKRRDLVEQRLRDIAAGNRKIESITSQKGAETKSGTAHQPDLLKPAPWTNSTPC